MKSFTCTTRYAFFLGKGGAGKSTMAAATALSLADGGKRVLLLGLDAASNLDEMLGVTLGAAPTSVPGAKNLHALNLDPRDIAPFAAWVGGRAAASYDHLIFDTAPSDACALGLPMGWSNALRLDDDLGTPANPAVLEDVRKVLTDPAQNTVVLVARPEASSLREAHRIVRRVGGLGLVRQQLVLNAVFHAHDPRDAQASAREARGRVALDLPAALSGIPRTEVPLEAFNMVGLTALRAVFGEGPPARTVGPVIPAAETTRDPSLGDLTDALSSPSGLVLVVGKGGVGKSTVAAALARMLVARGATVTLTTAEPSVGARVDRLRISVADPESQRAIVTAHDLRVAHAGAARDSSVEPLATRAALQALSRDLALATRETVVVDGASTGHTLQLVAAAAAHHRALETEVPPDAASRLQSPLGRLRDPELSRIVIVTTAERTAVTEAEALQTALRRAGIEPFAWVVNATVASTCTQDPLLRQWLASELVQIARVRRIADRYAVVPWAP